jgi:hypothetical protein
MKVLNTKFKENPSIIFLRAQILCASFPVYGKELSTLVSSLTFLIEKFWALVMVLFCNSYFDVLLHDCIETPDTHFSYDVMEKVEIALTEATDPKLWLSAPLAHSWDCAELTSDRFSSSTNPLKKQDGLSPSKYSLSSISFRVIWQFIATSSRRFA